ncbi:NDP-sugar dehydrogenase like UDP-glucose dehydrogenase [Alloalcanivorax dieselolei B5]|uniref:UDP-glucose 6-dehydrogenase n=1 Tax=Alcanivorax dieselolei (strain DSM 16502 / CGMCC 1.3690 / MCCC 1A00001 / B-5) TaxID=930169 RepID=K0C929_ALCDB|nr:nucleotide sugar dehydrogenase [Alloalcanivorax dieselolei]AFT70024.1 NDP-sugar dehydrogenase like UDP-glucose dehydrogenase [Alloalcanivorax dieselolei B5]GGK09194.1 UDP-glucose 6-dehydrogenase [Alloalcanivorax dieselolei]
MRVDAIGDTLCAAVTAAALAQTGHQVTWYLPEGRYWQGLQSGGDSYHEPGLMALVREQADAGHLTIQAMDALNEKPAPVVFMALSPGAREMAEAVLTWLVERPGCELLVNQSVFPVGTTEELQRQLEQRGHVIPVVCLPDTLQEGRALQDFIRPDHILLGCDDAVAERLVREILRPFNRRQDVIQVMRPREAEFAKLAISGMLATRLSFMNDMALLAEELDVDIDVIRQGMGSDSRIGEAYLYAGCGFGGPGFSRDVMSLTHTLRSRRINAELLEQVLQINERQKEVLFRKFWRHYEGEVSQRRVALWGVAFKPGSDRVDNGPALRLIEALWAQDVEVHVHDPLALPELSCWAEGRGPLVLHDDGYDAVHNCDALMVVTEWKEYWSPDWTALKSLMSTPVILDGRNIYDPSYVKSKGFQYYGIGRG